jgi:hypothetical protein
MRQLELETIGCADKEEKETFKSALDSIKNSCKGVISICDIVARDLKGSNKSVVPADALVYILQNSSKLLAKYAEFVANEQMSNADLCTKVSFSCSTDMLTDEIQHRWNKAAQEA